MVHKDEPGPHGPNSASKKENRGVLKDQKGPGQQNPKIGDQGPHGSGEGLTGMQPGAGHPRGR
jgi:hypothetical protein